MSINGMRELGWTLEYNISWVFCGQSKFDCWVWSFIKHSRYIVLQSPSQFPHPIYRHFPHKKRPWWWERPKAGREGDDKGQMVGWHHQLHGHGFEQAPGDGEGQRSLAWGSPCVRKSQTQLSDWTATISQEVLVLNTYTLTWIDCRWAVCPTSALKPVL